MWPTAPFNRLATGHAPASPNGQPQRATPVLDADFAPFYRYLYRYPNRFNRTLNRKREGPVLARALEGESVIR
jgi:hypothetical protein